MQRDLKVMSSVQVRQEESGDSVQESNEARGGKKHTIGMLMAENGHLTVDSAYTGITELKWGTTLEDAEKSMEYYFYLMFPMDSIPSILDHTNINLLTKKKAPLSKEDKVAWNQIGNGCWTKKGTTPDIYWKSESDAGLVSTAANYEGHTSQISIRVFNCQHLHNLCK